MCVCALSACAEVAKLPFPLFLFLPKKMHVILGVGDREFGGRGEGGAGRCKNGA